MTRVTDSTVSQDVLRILREKLPDFFTRSRVEELTNGLLSQATMYNLDRAGKGPKTHRMGRQICYIKDEFVDWIENYYRGMSHEYPNPRAEVHRGAATSDGA